MLQLLFICVIPSISTVLCISTVPDNITELLTFRVFEISPALAVRPPLKVAAPVKVDDFVTDKVSVADTAPLKVAAPVAANVLLAVSAPVTVAAAAIVRLLLVSSKGTLVDGGKEMTVAEPGNEIRSVFPELFLMTVRVKVSGVPCVKVP